MSLCPNKGRRVPFPWTHRVGWYVAHMFLLILAFSLGWTVVYQPWGGTWGKYPSLNSLKARGLCFCASETSAYMTARADTWSYKPPSVYLPTHTTKLISLLASLWSQHSPAWTGWKDSLSIWTTCAPLGKGDGASYPCLSCWLRSLCPGLGET